MSSDGAYIVCYDTGSSAGVVAELRDVDHKVLMSAGSGDEVPDGWDFLDRAFAAVGELWKEAKKHDE